MEPDTKNPQTIICSGAILKGNIKFGKGCVVHPYARINAEQSGEIIFGDYNIIEDYVTITNNPSKNKEGKLEPKKMTIGSFNLFEVGCSITDCEIGSYNEFGVRSTIPAGCSIQNNFSISPGITMISGYRLPNGYVVFKDGVTRRNALPRQEERERSIKELWAELVRILPSYHTLFPIADGKV